jgi:hypothetical protein
LLLLVRCVTFPSHIQDVFPYVLVAVFVFHHIDVRRGVTTQRASYSLVSLCHVRFLRACGPRYRLCTRLIVCFIVNCRSGNILFIFMLLLYCFFFALECVRLLVVRASGTSFSASACCCCATRSAAPGFCCLRRTLCMRTSAFTRARLWCARPRVCRTRVGLFFTCRTLCTCVHTPHTYSYGHHTLVVKSVCFLSLPRLLLLPAPLRSRCRTV